MSKVKLKKKDKPIKHSWPYIQVMNELIKGFIDDEKRDFAMPSFGSGMLCDDRFGQRTATSTLQQHRFTSKFFELTPSLEKALRKKCFAKWLDYEEYLKSKRIYTRDPNGKRGVYRAEWWANLTALDKRVLFKAREALHITLGDFSINLHEAKADFTPGETAWSSGGKVSVLQKLKNRENWQVTHDALDDFCRLVYHNASLKRAAKAHFTNWTRKKNRIEWMKACVHYPLDMHKVGFHLFSLKFKEMVTIVYGSVGDSVEKNNTTRRFITKSPMGNMILQRAVAHRLSHYLHHGWYNELKIGQVKHRLRIPYSGVSTIDFSSASDSIHCDLIHFLYPAAIRKYLFRYREDYVLLDEDYHAPEKLCSMGNGFCFEILTLTLLAIARQLDSSSSVYGDDVIISNDVASDFVKVMATVGFSVNNTKSFISSPFRESCGSFYYDQLGALTTFDFTWIKNPNDVIITLNKLQLIAYSTPSDDGGFGERLLQLRELLLLLCPPLLRGPDTMPNHFDEWVWDSGYIKARRTNADNLRKERSLLRTKLFEDCQLALASYDWDLSVIQVVERHKFVPKVLTPMTDFVRCPFQRAHYMFGNRMSIDRVRGRSDELDPKKQRGQWAVAHFLVFPNGFNVPLKDLVAIHNEMLLSLTVCGLLKSHGYVEPLPNQ